jgi:hypothetical protein
MQDARAGALLHVTSMRACLVYHFYPKLVRCTSNSSRKEGMPMGYGSVKLKIVIRSNGFVTQRASLRRFLLNKSPFGPQKYGNTI